MNGKEIEVLLIEDDPEDTFLLMNLMAEPGWPSIRFVLHSVENLQSGLEALEKGGIEAVLLDLMLPDSEGIASVMKVRAKAPDVPIVVLTGLYDEALGLDAISHGAQDYQVKGSIDSHALKRTISYSVERHRLFKGIKNIIEGAADAMVLLDDKGAVSYLNPAAEALFAWRAAEWLGKAFPYPLPSKSSNRRGELRIPSSIEGERIAEVRLSDIVWNDKPAVLASIRDITDMRKIEQLKAEVRERQKMDKLKDELISSISHEMRTPLTAIKAVASTLVEDTGSISPEKQSTLLKLQHRNVLRLQKIVNSILDLSRLESGKAVIHREAVNARHLIRETLDSARVIAGKQSVLFQEELPARMPLIYTDPDLFVQVLSNLLDNALRFTKTRVLIRAQVEEEVPADSRAAGAAAGGGVLTARKCLQISVIDDGPGIPTDHIQYLFNKFVQINRGIAKGQYQGTGLGLAICKEIIERQDGRIWAESAEGEGAKFHFTLPLYQPAAAHAHGPRRLR